MVHINPLARSPLQTPGDVSIAVYLRCCSYCTAATVVQCCPQVDASLRAGEEAQRKLTMLETALSLPDPDWERAAAEAEAARVEQQERWVRPQRALLNPG